MTGEYCDIAKEIQI